MFSGNRGECLVVILQVFQNIDDRHGRNGSALEGKGIVLKIRTSAVIAFVSSLMEIKNAFAV